MIILNIRVKPGSFRDEILSDPEGVIVKIREKPVDGAANDYLIRFLSKQLGIPKSRIILERGAGSRFKKISLDIDDNTFQAICIKHPQFKI